MMRRSISQVQDTARGGTEIDANFSPDGAEPISGFLKADLSGSQFEIPGHCPGLLFVFSRWYAL